jgi:predicted nucleic acid-binding protein
VSIWVVDAGPLIFLAKLDRLNLLQSAADEIYIPKAVLSEIQNKTDEATSEIEAATKNWLQTKKVEGQNAVELLLADLGQGEAEVITLATEIHADIVLLDDLDARRFARRVGLAPIGTLGLLLAARLKGEKISLKDEIDRLRNRGFWVSETLAAEILKAAGENEKTE